MSGTEFGPGAGKNGKEISSPQTAQTEQEVDAVINFRAFLDLCEDNNPNAEFVIFNKKISAVLGTARGFDQAKTKATNIRKQRCPEFDDASFMNSRSFYGNIYSAPSGERRMNIHFAAT